MNYYLIQATQEKKQDDISLVDGLIRVESIDYFKQLRSGCRVWKQENLEWNYGKAFKLYSPFANKVLDKAIHRFTSFEILERQIKDGNIYEPEVE